MWKSPILRSLYVAESSTRVTHHVVCSLVLNADVLNSASVRDNTAAPALLAGNAVQHRARSGMAQCGTSGTDVAPSAHRTGSKAFMPCVGWPDASCRYANSGVRCRGGRR